MYLHLGQDTTVIFENIIGIFDMDTSTLSPKTREFLARAEKEKRVRNVSYDLPKSFIVCRENGNDIIYISPISSQTLIKRKRKDMIL